MVSIRGVNLELHPVGEALSDHIRLKGDFFEAQILDFIGDNFPVHGTILDVGANIGNHSAYFAKFLQYRQLLAFEPVPENYILLVQNCAYYKSFYPFKFALSDHERLIRIEPNKSNMGASQIKDDGSVEVLAIPLDWFCLYDCTLIKLDVEYHEPKVLFGAQNTIQKNKPLILIEDSAKEYEPLLPDYDCIMGWEEEKTYLYKWKNT